MKKPEEGSVGYRIREARESVGINQKELAKMVGVTSSYMGMIERGDLGKNPSGILLNKIAQVTGKSYHWLLDGREEKDGQAIEIDALEKYWERVDVRLLLSLLCTYRPDITKEDLANMLRVTREEVESIIQGERQFFCAEWKTVLPALMKQLDIPSLYEKMGMIAGIWEASREREHCSIALHAMENLVVGTWEGNIACASEEEREYSRGNYSSTRVIKKTFQCQRAPYSKWDCVYIINAPSTISRATELIRDILDSAKKNRECDEISFAFTDEARVDFYLRIINSVLTSTEGILFSVSIMHVDPERREATVVYSVSDDTIKVVTHTVPIREG